MTAAVPPALRPARPADAARLAWVHRTAWVETYAGLLPAEHWRTDTLERRAATWARWLDGGVPVTVAERDGEIVGFAIAGASTTVGEHPPVRDHQLYALYVLAAHHGTGTGQVLLDAVVAPGTPAQLWVARDNPKARAFYGRNGFEPDGATHVDPALHGLV
ncbi:GNAT family N-acetyltransferase, partial [Isoptericola variabilis]